MSCIADRVTVHMVKQVKLVSLGDVQAKVSFRGDVASRPRWAARLLSWGLDLADFEGVPIRLTGFEVHDATMLWSVFIGCGLCSPPWSWMPTPQEGRMM